MTRVKVVGAYLVHHNYAVWPVADGQEVDGGLADEIVSQGLPCEILELDGAQDVDGDGVPDGAASLVVNWVGDDPAKAQQAIDAENARERPRTTLLATLAKIVTPPEPVTPPDPPVDPAA